MSKEGDRQRYEQTALCEVPSLAVAAHELKAPLALIRQLSLLLRNEPAGVTLGQSDVRQLLERLTATSERSIRLVEMLTRQARLEDGLFELEPLHIGRECEDVAHELQPMCKVTGQRIEVRLPRKTTLALANRELLRSILFGLCDNAFASNGEQPIVLGATTNAHKVRVGVRDFGPRLQKQNYKTLKARLGRSAQPIGGRPGSSGLGLYIAGQFAQAMHGSIGMVRHQNSGATFYVETPLSAQLRLL